MVEALLFFGLFAVMIAVILVASHQAARRRTEAIRAAAADLGWNFREEVLYDTIPKLERFELFATGRSRKLNNLLTSPAGELCAVVFDYTYVTGGGKSQQTHKQTVFYATGDRLDLPVFSLRPENFLHRVAGIMGYQDIDLAERPEFSRLFLLRGADEGGVLAAFNDVVAAFFERHAGMCAAAKGHELLFWRPGKFAKPEELPAFITAGFELGQAFSGSARAET